MANLFQKQAGIYAVTRPSYPPALFSLLSSLTEKHERAWDVGTGNGQAAVPLAEFYDEVIATDVSDEQLKHAVRRPNITYVCTSKQLSREEVTKYVGDEGSVDLVTAAEAVHWFDLPSFYDHVKHVLRKPGGVIAVWCYIGMIVSPEVDAVLTDVYRKARPYWERRVIELVEGGYKSLDFPFEAAMEGGTGPLEMENKKEMTLEGMIGYVNSWSAVNKARERGVELFGEQVIQTLTKAWGSPDQIRTWTVPLHLRVGTVAHV